MGTALLPAAGHVPYPRLTPQSPPEVSFARVAYPGKLGATNFLPNPHPQLNFCWVLELQPVQPKCGETLTPLAGQWGSDAAITSSMAC